MYGFVPEPRCRQEVIRTKEEARNGQRQRIAIARALINNPILILADEPTGNLDPETSEEIVQLLQDITSQKTVLMASHDKYLMDRFPKRTIICDKNYVYEK